VVSKIVSDMLILPCANVGWGNLSLMGGGVSLDKKTIGIMMLKYDIKARSLVAKGVKYDLFDVIPIPQSSKSEYDKVLGVARKKAMRLRESSGLRVRVYSRPHAKSPHIRIYVRA